MSEPRSTTQRLQELAARPWLRNSALGLFCLYVFVLAAVAISAGTGEVTFGATVWGQRQWVIGRTVALRISPRDPSRRGAFIPGFGAEVTVTPAGGAARTLATVRSGITAQSVGLRLPADLPPGPATVEVRLERGAQGDVARAEVELVPTAPTQAPPARVKPRKSPTTAAEAPPPAVAVAVRPVGGVLVPELLQRIVVRAVDPTGGPVQTTLALKVTGGKLEGLPEQLQTDAHGLATAWVRPNYHELKLVVTPDGQPVQTVELHGRPAQFSADVGPMVTPTQGALTVAVESMHGHAPIHADLWQDGRWIDATSGVLSDGKAQVKLAAPEPGALALVQVYRHFAAPGEARAILHIWPGPDPVAALPQVGTTLGACHIERAWARRRLGWSSCSARAAALSVVALRGRLRASSLSPSAIKARAAFLQGRACCNPGVHAGRRVLLPTEMAACPQLGDAGSSATA